jgi:hypothetical protein
VVLVWRFRLIWTFSEVRYFWCVSYFEDCVVTFASSGDTMGVGDTAELVGADGD